jgi:hypothetical protein
MCVFSRLGWITLLIGVAAAGCGLSDLFRPSGLARVTLTYPESDTVLTLGTTTRPAVAVRADDVAVPNPHLRFSSSDTTIVAVTAGADSLIARGLGGATITVVLLDPIFTDTLPTITQGVKVKP